MDSARKHVKGHQDFHVFEDIPKDPAIRATETANEKK